MLGSIRRYTRGGLFYVGLSLSAVAIVVLLIPPLLSLSVHSKRVIRWRRMYLDFVCGMFFEFAASLLLLVSGTKLFIYSSTPIDELLADQGALLLCNHRTRVDWMYAGWCYCAALGFSQRLRFILKDSLRSVPFFGWGMQLFMFIFLRRKREGDLPHISKMISYLVRTGARPTVFLFPEGTDLSDSNKERSNAYAREKQLPPMEYVLYPRTSGLGACLGALRGQGAAVHDITIAYRDFKTGNRTSELSLLKGMGHQPFVVLSLCFCSYPPFRLVSPEMLLL